MFELFEFNESEKCETLEMLIKQDGFNITKTPTVERHLGFLEGRRKNGEITGLSMNSNVYTK